MSNLDYIKKLYKGKNCYSDHMHSDELSILHISSNVEGIIENLVSNGKIVFITGNPGDGKTFIIKTLNLSDSIYQEKDLNNVGNYHEVAEKIIKCYDNQKAALIAANEYPFLLLQKEIRSLRADIANEIDIIKESAIIYDNTSADYGKIVVIDLNNRTLLDKDREIPKQILQRMHDLLIDEPNLSVSLKYNLNAINSGIVQERIVDLFNMAGLSNEHYAMRDILGAFSYILTICETEEDHNKLYYQAIFDGSNELLKAIQQYDPIYLSSPELDERLWNGDIKTGWLFDIPEIWPADERFDDDVESALQLFKDIKRKYYFENTNEIELKQMQPSGIMNMDLFANFESQKTKIKDRIIRAINKLFLPSENNRKELCVWTSHHYNLSMETSVAVSTSYIPAKDLELSMPRPTRWLETMEYVPNHLILRPKRSNDSDLPSLILDVDFLRVLESVDKGYPVALLPPSYKQSANTFLQQLYNAGYTEEYDDGEIVLASRNKSYKRVISIQDNKYSFNEED